METKNIQEKFVQKSIKSCNYPELSVQISCVFYIAKKTFGCRHPKKRAIIWIVQLSGDYCILGFGNFAGQGGTALVPTVIRGVLILVLGTPEYSSFVTTTYYLLLSRLH